MWLHGAFIVLFYGFGAILAGAAALAVIWPLQPLVAELGWDVSRTEMLVWSAIVWLPLGVGFMARYCPSEHLQGDNYPRLPTHLEEWQLWSAAEARRLEKGKFSRFATGAD